MAITSSCAVRLGHGAPMIEGASGIQATSEGPAQFGALNPLATELACAKFGLPLTQIDRRVSLFSNTIDPNTVKKTPLLAAACSQFARTPVAYQNLLEGSHRTEVHGPHTIPACVEIAQTFLDISRIDELEIIKHQISKPIDSQLTLVAYEKVPRDGVPNTPLCLSAQFKINGRNVFIRGYETATPIIYVLQDSLLHTELRNATRIDFQNELGSGATLYPAGSPLGKGGASPLSSCLAGVKLLEIVEYHGSYLLRNGFFQMQGGKAYVSRIRDYKGSAQHLLGASDSELRITYEEDTYRKIGTTSLLDISFTWQTKEERVGGILTLAIVEFSKSACW